MARVVAGSRRPGDSCGFGYGIEGAAPPLELRTPPAARAEPPMGAAGEKPQRPSCCGTAREARGFACDHLCGILPALGRTDGRRYDTASRASARPPMMIRWRDTLRAVIGELNISPQKETINENSLERNQIPTKKIRPHRVTDRHTHVHGRLPIRRDERPGARRFRSNR